MKTKVFIVGSEGGNYYAIQISKTRGHKRDI